MKKRASLLVVDDEKSTRDGLVRALQRQYDVQVASDGAQALHVLDEQEIDVVLSDLRMPGMDGLTLIQRILARPSSPACILLTAYGSIDTAVEAIKRGASDFLTKPVNLDELEIRIQSALRSRSMEQENQSLRQQLDERFGLESMVGQSPALLDVLDTIRQVAPARTNVLISGETGTGKELVARAIHQLSPRAKAPLITVHCAALPANLLESELFGHEKGSFTGATERRPGRFEMADGGSLFLDEIGEIDSTVQVKILRVLEERTFERVGGRETLDVDVRLIAATNRDLEAMVNEGTFREDLFYRLNVVTVALPSLRERREDIPLLMRKFLDEFSAENKKEIEGVTSDCMNALIDYNWPGNIRELRNVIERMVVLSRQPRLTLRDLPPHIRPDGAGRGSSRTQSQSVSGDLSLEEMERNMILRALETNQGSRTKAAEALGISRRTLHRKLNEYGLRDGEEE